MIRKYISDLVGFPLQDIVRGTRIIATLKFLEESQNWDADRLNEYRLTKLKKLVKYAYENVPYYYNTFSKIKLKPTDIINLDDITKIPILTKEIFRKENFNLIARNYDRRLVKIGKTGGTTGVPVIVYKDTFNRSFALGSYYRWYKWMGIELSDPIITLWGDRSVLSHSFKQKVQEKTINWLQNNQKIGSFNLNEKTLPKIADKISKYRPVLIKGYLSALITLGRYINDNSLSISPPKAVSSTTETLLPSYREFLENVYNAPVYDQYGCGEVTAIAYECAKHTGLHVNMEHVLIEILDNQDKSVIGESGRIIATDLDNLVMPFIRYENGDLAVLSEKACECGINQPLLDSITGRSIDTIILKDGSNVHGVFFTSIFFELGISAEAITRFQVIQDKPGVILLRLEATHKMDERIPISLKKTLLKYFDSLDITIEYYLENEPNGKFRYIKNNYINSNSSAKI